MMNRDISRRTVCLATALAVFIGLAALSAMSAANAAEVPENFDNQGGKIFTARQQTPTGNLSADSGGRTLSKFYELRQYPGSPPRIPHIVNLSFSGNETDCLSCHRKGGYSPEFNAFAPVTPHPENILCSQCHTLVQSDELFVETDWLSISPPRLGQSFLPGSPPAIPHSLQLRENCIACHTGPGAVAEIRVDHASRGDCRQCHVNVMQSQPLSEFIRE
jgi:cytochrome c-type protein NapB